MKTSAPRLKVALKDQLEDGLTPSEKESLRYKHHDNRIAFFNHNCIVQVANNIETRLKAYEFIRNIYSAKGYANDSSSKLWLSIYDAIPETTTLIVESDEGIIEGALTVVFDSALGLPADEIYKQEIDGLRKTGHHLSEIISFGIRKENKNTIKILASLYYSAYVLAHRVKNKTDFIVTVNPQHEKFYVDKLIFKRIGGIRRYHKVNGAPAVLLNLPFSLPNKLKEKKRIFPLYMLDDSYHAEMLLADKLKKSLLPMSDMEFFKLFISESDVWENASAEQQRYIKNQYSLHNIDHHAISREMARSFAKKWSKQIEDTENTKEEIKIKSSRK